MCRLVWTVLTAVNVVLSVSCGTPQDSVSAAESASPPTAVQFVVSAVHPTVKLGDPVLVNLALRNDGKEAARIDAQMIGHHGSIKVLDPMGNQLAYVGAPYQTAAHVVTLKPSETVTFRRDIDLTTTYVFERPGAYSIVCRSGHYDGVRDSEPIQVIVGPGKLSPSDASIARMLARRPEGWHIYKHYESIARVRPAGRHEVRGGVIYVWWKSSHTVENKVRLWLTDEPSELDPSNDSHLVEFPKGASEYWGKTEFGHLYVYIDLDALHFAEDPNRRKERDAPPPNRDEVVVALREMLGLIPLTSEASNPPEPATTEALPIIALPRGPELADAGYAAHLPEFARHANRQASFGP